MNPTTKTPINTSLKIRQRGFFSAQKTEPGTIFICEQGILWLTQSNDLTDYVLKAGDKLVVNKKTSILIEAMSEARISIVHAN